MKSQNKGITLVALVITIAVLIIISSITIGLSNEENTIHKAEETRDKVENLQIEQEIKATLLKLQDIEDTVSNKAEWLEEKLNAQVTVNSNGSIIILYKGYEIGVDNDYYNIQYINKEI